MTTRRTNGKHINHVNAIRRSQRELWARLRPDQVEYAEHCLRSWGWPPSGLRWLPAVLLAAKKAIQNRP